MTGAAAARRPRDWDADTYDRVSGLQERWGLETLDRLALSGDETVLDAGCGSGRVTRALAARLPEGRVLALDASPAMVEKARAALPDNCDVAVADLSRLTLDAEVDAILSTATFHWIADHRSLYDRLHRALRPGGRLVAQCGGEGNIESLRAVLVGLGEEPPFAEHLAGWDGPWNFRSAADTARDLEAVGFADVRCRLEPKTVSPSDPRAFLRTVTLGFHLDHLPAALRDPFVDATLERLPAPLALDYVRLNIDASRS